MEPRDRELSARDMRNCINLIRTWWRHNYSSSYIEQSQHLSGSSVKPWVSDIYITAKFNFLVELLWNCRRSTNLLLVDAHQTVQRSLLTAKWIDGKTISRAADGKQHKIWPPLPANIQTGHANLLETVCGPGTGPIRSETDGNINESER